MNDPIVFRGDGESIHVESVKVVLKWMTHAQEFKATKDGKTILDLTEAAKRLVADYPDVAAKVIVAYSALATNHKDFFGLEQ